MTFLGGSEGEGEGDFISAIVDEMEIELRLLL